MNILGDWLARIGLQRYTDVFENNQVDLDILADLGEMDLEKLGIGLGDRKRLVRAIEDLRAEQQPGARPVLLQRDPGRPGPHGISSVERRQITAFYCDLVDSTALSVQFDPEDLHELIWQYRGACQRTVEHYGGFVRGYEGDGIMVYFGYPRAFEDDAERAVRAGLELIDSLKALDAGTTLPEGVSVSVRVGIATGEVVAGALVGESGLMARDAAIGMPPNLAARLQAFADPNTLVICPNTHALARGQFDYRELGVQTVKGFDKPVGIWQVLGIRTSVSRFEAASGGGLNVFIDRGEELDLLNRNWDRVLLGEGRVVCISGEPGIGKSRLTDEFMARIGGQPLHRVRYQFSPHHMNNALYPAIRHVEQAAGVVGDDTNEQKLDKLDALAASVHESFEHCAPLLAALLSLPTGERYPAIPFGPQRQKSEILRLLAELLVALSRDAPVAFLVEDLHWSDASSRDLLDLLVERIRDARVLLLVTFRHEAGTPWLGQPHVTPLSVNRLSRPNIRALIHGVTAGREFPEPLLGQIMTRTDGIPLFVEELTTAVLESGILEERNGRFVLTSKAPTINIPYTLKDSLQSRLDQLGAAKETAQIGAALGREFPGEILAAVSMLDDTEIAEALDMLVRSKLVYRRGTSTPVRYVFRHALIQEAAYESMLKSRRQKLHARIAKTIEERFPTLAETEPHLLAHHHIHAEQFKAAVEYLLNAGRSALRRSAFVETIGYMTRATELVPHIGDAWIRDRQELEIYFMLGAAHRITSGFASTAAEECFKRARVLCDRLGTAAERVTVLRGLWMCHFTRGELAAARDLAEQTIVVAREDGDDGSIMLGHWMFGTILFWQGEFTLARRELEAALALYEPGAQRQQLLSAQLDPGVAAMGYLSWSLALLGFPDQARQRSDEAVARARDIGEPFTLAFTLIFACCARLTLNRDDDIRQMLDEVRQVNEKHGFSHWKNVAQVIAGQVEIAAGRSRMGIALVEEGCRLLRTEGSTVNLPWSIAVAAAADAEANRPRQALARVTEAIALAEETGEHHWLADLHRIKGELLSVMPAGNSAEAQECVQRAADIARAQGAKLIELRAATTLARMATGSAAGPEARQALAAVLGSFTEGFEAADLLSAAEALRISP